MNKTLRYLDFIEPVLIRKQAAIRHILKFVVWWRPPAAAVSITASKEEVRRSNIKSEKLVEGRGRGWMASLNKPIVSSFNLLT